MKTTDTVHYGKKLLQRLNNYGMSKKRVCELLAINYRTLMNRLEDGEFTVSQINKLKEKGYL